MHHPLGEDGAAEAANSGKGIDWEGGGVTPAVKYHTAGAKVRVGSIEAIEAIGNAVATLIAFCNKSTPE